MANSTSANLKLTVQATGENSGTWGQITNTNLLILEQAIGGYDTLNLTNANRSLTFSNGALSNGKNAVIKLTGTLESNLNVTIPDSIEKTFVVANGTSGAYTVTFKTSSGTGVTWATDDKSTKMVFSDGTNVVDTAFTDLLSDTSPQLAANLDTNDNNIIIDDNHHILDENSNEQLTFQTTSSAVNNTQLTNAATGNAPEIAAIGGDSNVDLNINPKGIGRVTLGAGAIEHVAEKTTVSATAATGTINFDVTTQALLYYTTNASGDWTLNIRGDGSNSLDSIMDTGETITIVHMVTIGGSEYRNSAVQVDGSGVTPEWAGGEAPTEGNTNSIDVYTYSVIKTGSATFKVLAAQTQFA
jgi:hypothetical protein